MTAALAALNWLDLAATIVIAGGRIYIALVAPPSAAGRRALGRATVALAVLLPIEFAVTALRMREVSGVEGVALIVDLLDARWGRLWVLRCFGLFVLARAERLGRGPAAVLAWLWLLARSFQGHAGAHGALPAAVDWIHLTAASAWLGSLVQLALVPPPIAVETASRVRRLATAALAAVIPAGVYGAFLHIPRPSLLVTTPYGRALLCKLGLAAVLIGLGTANHFRHVPAVQRGDAAAARSLGRTVRLEVAVAAVLLLLTALVGVLPMPHAAP